MADDFAVRLVAALDRAETEARDVSPRFTGALNDMVSMSGGHNDIAEFALNWNPSVVLRLIERDRTLLDRHRRGQSQDMRHQDGTCTWCAAGWPCEDVVDAAAFWGVTDGT